MTNKSEEDLTNEPLTKEKIEYVWGEVAPLEVTT